MAITIAIVKRIWTTNRVEIIFSSLYDEVYTSKLGIILAIIP